MDENEIVIEGLKYAAAEPIGLSCKGCAFSLGYGDSAELLELCDRANAIVSCCGDEREDGKYIIWMLA